MHTHYVGGVFCPACGALVSDHWNELIQMSGHSTWFHGEIKNKTCTNLLLQEQPLN